MSFPRINLGDLTRMQRDWAALMPDNPFVAGFGSDDGRLSEQCDFGSNPGHLRMLHYVPETLAPGAPLVVVLHGCSLEAGAFDAACGWSVLAERHGFALLYPEQSRNNNAHGCFNWFEPGNVTRGHGEIESIRQMVAAMLAAHRCDPARVFVTGLSAGGAMTAALLANHPEVFAAGAIVAGLPFGAATDARQALSAMSHSHERPAAAWGGVVRAASPGAARWPCVTLWQGNADHTVSPGNAIELAKQWTDVHGVAEAAGVEDFVDGVPHRVWRDRAGDKCVELYAVPGLDHGVPIDPAGEGDRGVGHASRFVLDAGISAPWHIARSWNLVPSGSGLKAAIVEVLPRRLKAVVGKLL